MSRIRDHHDEFSTGVGLLLKITLAPVIWAFHFTISYGGAAVWCAKYLEGGDIMHLQIGLGVLTLVSLIGIALCGFVGWRSWTEGGYGEGGAQAGLADDESRNRFLGHIAVLLAVVSFIGVIFDVLPVMLIGSCT